jgi:hypothetical protein
MSVREVPRQEWAAALERFSLEHRSWLTRVGEPGSERPLASVDAEAGSIVIRFAGDALVRVDAPSAVRILETEDGAHRGMDVESPGGITRLRFRAAARPETLDGAAPGELGAAAEAKRRGG